MANAKQAKTKTKPKAKPKAEAKPPRRITIPGLKLSIRLKMMFIGSLIVVLSVSILTYVALSIFTEDSIGMVKYFTTNTNDVISAKIEDTLRKEVEHHTLIHRSSRSSKGRDKTISASFYGKDTHLLYTAAIKPNPSNFLKSKTKYTYYNAGVLRKQKLNPGTIRRQALRQKTMMKRCLAGELVIANVSHMFQRPVWLLCAPQVIKKRTLDAMLISLISAERLQKAFPKLEGGHSALDSMLIDSNGRALVFRDANVVLSGAPMTEHPAIARLLRAKTKTTMFPYDAATNPFRAATTPEDELMYAAVRKLDLGSVGVITTMPESSALASVKEVRIDAILISLIILTSAMLFTYIFAKTMADPIRSLVDAANRIRTGDYELKLIKRSQDEVGELTDAFNEMAQGLAEREQLKGALTKFVNPEIAEKALRGEISLGGERKDATIFFSDIRSFTAISETMEPEQVVEFLNEYMELMVDIIDKQNGVVDKFIGDAIMALWGVPESKGNDAENSVNAALMMREALLKFNEGRGSVEKPIIHIGCGINSGPCVAGQIGSENRLEYTVIGDAVNLASRVEMLNKPFGTDILISQDTFKATEGLYKTEPMQKIKVKGKAKPQQIYAVLGFKGDKKAPKDVKELQKLLKVKPPKKTKGGEKKYEILEG